MSIKFTLTMTRLRKKPKDQETSFNHYLKFELLQQLKLQRDLWMPFKRTLNGFQLKEDMKIVFLGYSVTNPLKSCLSKKIKKVSLVTCLTLK